MYPIYNGQGYDGMRLPELCLCTYRPSYLRSIENFEGESDRERVFGLEGYVCVKRWTHTYEDDLVNMGEMITTGDEVAESGVENFTGTYAEKWNRF